MAPRVTTVHVFGLKPNSRGEQEGYGYPLWEPEPPESASNEEYSGCEDRNPIWGLRDDLGCNLDQDFVEYFGPDRDKIQYVSTMIKQQEDVEDIHGKIGHCNYFVLIFEEAFHGRVVPMKDTEVAIYCGVYDCQI